jgi:hypothetical protein
MKYLLALALIALTGITDVLAQSTNGRIFTTPLAGTVRLRDVEDKYNAQVFSLEAPEPDGEDEQEDFRALKAAVERNFPHRRAATVNMAGAKTSAAVPQPILVRGFEPDSNTAIPPDNYMAVNNGTDGVNVHNSMISTVNTVTGALQSRVSLYNFTAGVGLGMKPFGGDYNRYDPKIMYDPEADRFFFVTLAGVDVYNHIILGFSQTNDPTGDWNLYKFVGDYAGDISWFDYPTISITHNEVFLTGNKLNHRSSFMTGFRKSVIYQIRKKDGYNGQTLTTHIWDNVNYGGAPLRNLFPVKGGGSLKGPEQYFLSLRNVSPLNDSVFLVKLGDTINGANNSISIAALKSNLSYGFPPNGRQPRIKDKLQTNDARVLGAFVEGGEIQFVSTTLMPATGADAIYHGIISNYTSSPVVTASYITVDTMDFGYPNISYSGMNGGAITSIISFDYSGPHHYPGVAAVFWDGTAHSELLEIKKGDSSIKLFPDPDSVQRWGDYTGSQPRWNIIGHVWMVGLWGKRDKSYGDWMALLRSPYSVNVPSVPTSNAGASALYPNPAFRFFRLRFKLNEDAKVRFAIYSISGALVDELVEVRCERGENELQFNTAALAPGQYLIRGRTVEGEVLLNKTFVKE